MRFRGYRLVERAVQEGAAYGVRRAHKHEQDPPQEAIIEAVVMAVMHELDELIEWDDDAAFRDLDE